MEKIKAGKHGEAIAINHLIQCGCEIIGQNIQLGHKELDIVARKNNVMHFIEVKTRFSNAYGGAVYALTPQKRNRFIHAVQLYLKRHRLDNLDISLDFMAIDIDENGEINLEWIHNITL